MLHSLALECAFVRVNFGIRIFVGDAPNEATEAEMVQRIMGLGIYGAHRVRGLAADLMPQMRGRREFRFLRGNNA